jgi:alanine racemase
MPFHRATYAEIDLTAFRHNLRVLRSLVAPGVQVMAVVKADAYGHGAGPCAKAAVEAGADILGISILEEGIELRENGIQAPILVLGSVFPDEIDDLIRHDLATSLWSLDLARSLSEKARKAGKTIGVHLKVDTGMGRLGMAPEEFPCFLKQILEYPNLRIDGVFTHLSSADEEDSEFTRRQLSRFNEVVKGINSVPSSKLQIHSANSAALVKYPESHFDLVRPGIMLYGALTSPGIGPAVANRPEMSGANRLQPVMQLK